MTKTADYDTALAATQRFHTKNKGFSGRFLLRYLDDVTRLTSDLNARTMLDYGCGRGEQYECAYLLKPGEPPLTIQEHLRLESIAKFDPGYPPFADDPVGKFDLVICTQVLGSIPISDLPWVLDKMAGYASKGVYIAEVLCAAPRKQLHAHLAGKMPHGWDRDRWESMIGAASARAPDVPFFFRTKDKRIPKGPRVLGMMTAGEHFRIED